MGTSDVQAAVAHALAELDAAVDVLADKWTAVVEHVQNGHLSESAIIAKAMDIQQRLAGATRPKP